jgi:hypothetical protein
LAQRHRTRPSPVAFGVDPSRNGRGEAAAREVKLLRER